MYGTVARLELKPGVEDQLRDLMASYDSLDVPGFVGSYLYRLDDRPNDYYLVVLFEDRESYRRNAEDPEQDRRYRQMRHLLDADPKWHDGEVVSASGRGG